MITEWEHCPPLNPAKLGLYQSITSVRHPAPSVAQCDTKPKPSNLVFKPKSSASKPKAKKSEHSEKSLQCALARHYDWRIQEMFFNVEFGGGVADVVMVTKARYIVEFEIKISLSDWNADQHKDKWQHPSRKKISRFYYVVPEWLAAKAPDWLPPNAGIISVTEGGYCKVVKEAPKSMAYKATVKDYAKFYRSCYYKHMTKVVHKGE